MNNSFSDLTVTNDKACLYRVRAVHAAATSANSTSDLAVTVTFTNNPLAVGTVVQAMHLSQRQRFGIRRQDDRRRARD